MKKKTLFLGILSFTLVFSLLFMACPSGDDDDESSEPQPLKLSNQQVYEAKTGGISIVPEFIPSTVSTAIAVTVPDTVGDSTVTVPGAAADITKGKLSLTVPIPPEYLLTTIDELIGESDEGIPQGITITPADAKGYRLELTCVNGSSLNLMYMEMGLPTSTGSIPFNVGGASYVYVDREVTINGEATMDGLKIKADNAKLKKGWNVLLFDVAGTVSLTDGSITGSGTITVGETPPEKFKWILSSASEVPYLDSRQQLLPQFNLLF